MANRVSDWFFFGELFGDGPGEGKAVERRGAAADFVQQHQAIRCRIVQNIRRLGHLDHESRATTGEIIRRTDARENPIDRADARTVRRDETAAIGKQHDQRRLAHVSGFTAHVRAGDEQHLPRGRERRVIVDEVIDGFLNNGMAARPNIYAALVGESRRDIVQRDGAFGQRTQHINFSDGARGALQGADVRQQLLQLYFVQ